MGELSLAEAEEGIKRMARLTSDMFDGLVDVMGRPTEDLSQRVADLKRMEDTCDEMLHDITAYLIQCSTHEIGAGNALRMQSGAAVQTEMIFIDMNNHLEAVANHALNVIQAGRRDQAAT